MRFFFLAVLAWAAVDPTIARAQTRWAVLAAASSEADAARAIDLAEHSRAALDAQGESTLDRDRGLSRIEAQLAAPFTPPPDGLVARLARTAEAVLEEVAFGRNQRALDLGDPLLEEIVQHVVAIGRLDDAARDLANLTLYLVRAEIQLRRPDEARARVEAAIALVPDLEADERLHPEMVRSLVASVRAALDASSIGGTLAVQAGATDPEGCAIRVNGRSLGRTPWVRVPLPSSGYGVQVECGEGAPGRIFSVRVEHGQPTRLTVPVRLASALDARGLALVYDGSAELQARLGRDVEQLGRILDVDRVLVAVIDGGTMAVRAFEIMRGAAAARLTGSAPVAQPVDVLTSREAVQLARSGRRLGEPSATAPAEQRSGDVPSSSTGGGDVGVAVLGGSLLTVGVVGLGIAWYFWSDVDARGQAVNRAGTPDELEQSQRDFDAARTPVLIAGAVGSALTLAGAAFLTSQSSEDLPWWTWVVGGAGLAVAGVGAYLITTEGACYGNTATSDGCLRRSPSWLLGALVLEHAAPLLAVPITSLIQAAVRGDGGSAPTATLRMNADGVSISVSGSL